MSKYVPMAWVRPYNHSSFQNGNISVKLVVDGESIALTYSEDYTVDGDITRLTEKTRERIAAWKEQKKTVKAVIEYSAFYVYQSEIQEK